MDRLRGLVARLRAIVRGRSADRELDEEIRFHLERETERNVQLGLSSVEARRRALAAFGGVRRVKEEHREVRGVPWLEQLAADVRFAMRMLVRGPGLAAAAILTLALGIGANTAIFSAVNAVILRPLPFPAPDRLVMLWEENAEKGWHQNDVAPANFLDWKEQVPAFQDAAAYQDGIGNVTLTGDGSPRLLRRVTVTGSFFDVLGVSARLGRTLREEETWANGTHVAVLSHRVWRDQFGADPAIIGRTIQLDGASVQVVGVMAERFAFPSPDVDVWMSMEWDRAARGQIWFRRAHWPRAIARLRPGVAPAEANAQLQSVVNRLETQYPETNRYMGAGMTPLHEFLVGGTRRPLLVLLGAVALLLAIACANVGNLMLVRAAAREREITLRLALGAGRLRVVRQAITESLVISMLGGAAGLALGWIGTRALISLEPEGLLRVRELGLDWTVLAYVFVIATVSGLLFGIAPALWNGRRAPAEALKEGGRGGSEGRRMRRWGDALVIGEVALTLLLTVGAGLLVRSFWELRHVSPGFDPDGVLTASIELSGTRYDSAAAVASFFDHLAQRARALPGVESASLVSGIPLTGSDYTSDYIAQGRASDDYGTEVAHRRISPDYFRTMRVPVLRGRIFTAADRKGAPSVVVINEALARGYFRDQDPVGQRIAFDKVPDSTTTWSTIVGVVGSERQTDLSTEPRIEVFAPFAQERSAAMSLVVRTRGAPGALAPAIRRVVAELDPNLAIMSLRTMDEVRAASLTRERFLMTLLLVFAGVGLALAVVGVYGVLAQVARRRTREMGIRIALGARSGEVRWMVVRHGLRLVLLGLVVGGGVSLVATRSLATLLYRVPPADPLTFAAVAVVLAVTGVLASLIPAVQASRADPAQALRGE